MFLDDDEWFVEIDELIHFFKSGEYKQYGYANYQVRNFYEPSYTHYSDSWASRMIRIDKDTAFRGRIHEYMYPVQGKCKNIYALVYHSGYIFVTDEQKKAHFERNASLLHEMIKEEPDNLRWKVQLAQEYRTVKAWQELCDFCEECIEATKDINNSYDNVQVGTFYAGYVEGLLFLQNYGQALNICTKALEDKRNTELCVAFMHLCFGVVHLNLGNYDEAREYVQQYLKEIEVLSQNEEVMLVQTMAAYVNEAFDENNIKKAYSILISSGIKQGSIQELHEYYERLELDQPVLYFFDGTEKYLIEAMAKMEYHPMFAQMIEDGYKNKELRELMRNEAQSWRYKNEDAFRNVMFAHAQADVDDWYVWYARIYAGAHTKNKELLENALLGFYRTFPNVFVFPEEVEEYAKEVGVTIAEGWRSVPADKWKTNTRDYLEQIGLEHLEQTRAQMKQVFLPEDWRYEFFELVVLERSVAKGPKEPWNLSAYYEELSRLVEATLKFYGRYYREEAFVEYPQALPKNVQAVIHIMEFLELEAQDKKAGLSSLKEAAFMNPAWANGLRKFIEYYPQMEHQRARKQREELRNLRNQVMAQVEDMLQKGQTEQAIAIIAQLKQMVPNDLEVIELGLRARLKSLEEG